MGKSARVLGGEFGRTARDMNALLKEHGYLYGEPGAYGLTEKGEQYAEEHYHHRGTGGYAHYNRHWETRTWSDDTAAALRADMEAEHADPRVMPLEAEPAVTSEAADVDKSFDEFGRYIPIIDVDGDEDPEPTWGELAARAAVIAAFAAAPLAKPVWDKRVKPAAVRVVRRLRSRFPKSSPVASGHPDTP